MERYKQRIYQYIERAFENAPDTQAVREAKEELSANLADQFEERLKSGDSPEDAYYAAISSIGDIYEVLDSLQEETDSPSGRTDEAVGSGHLWDEISSMLPYGASAGMAVLICILFYKPELANLWKAAICAVAALLLIGFIHFGHVRKNKKLIPSTVMTAFLLAATFVSAFLPINTRFEGILWLVLLIVLAGYEAAAAIISFFKKRKEKKHESESSAG